MSLPPPPISKTVFTTARGRRKSVAVREMKRDEETEEGREDLTRMNSVKIELDDFPLSDQPSTSAAAAAADRSISRKRGRQSLAVKSKPEEPMAKRKANRRSAHPGPESEEKEELEEEPEKITPTVKHRNRRTASQILMADVRDEEKIEDKAEDGLMTTRRRSFRGPVEDAADATAAAAADSSRENKPQGGNASRTRSKTAKKHKGTSDDRPELVAPPVLSLESYNDVDDDEREAIDDEIGEEKKAMRQLGGKDSNQLLKKPSISFLDTSASSSMLMDESTAEMSGYGEEASMAFEMELDDEADEREEKEEEEQASTSAASAAVPVKRGRGRPRRDGLPPIPRQHLKKKEMEVEPMMRDRRSNVLSQKFVEYMTDETTKIARRASAGAGMAITPRTLAAAGVSVDLPSPRRRPPTPPPPEVKAPTGSALSIMRSIKGKKLPSIRSPSPTAPTRRSYLKPLTAAAATLKDAPPIDAAPAADKKKESPAPGPSRKLATVHAPPQSDEGLEEDKEEEEEEGEKAPASPVWITMDNIRGRSVKKMVRPIEQDPVTGKLTLKESPEPTEEAKKKGEGAKEEDEDGGEGEGGVEDGEEKEEEENSKAEDEPPASPANEEEPGEIGDVLARWNESRKAIDQKRLEAGLPVLPPTSSTGDELSAAPLAPRPSRRSVNAPARFGDYDLNYGDVRKRSATVTTPSTALPLSPGLSEASKKRRKKEETAATPTTSKETPIGGGEEEMKPSGSRKRSRVKKDKKRPRIVLKLKLPGSSAASAAATPIATPAAGEEEEPMEDDLFGEGEEEEGKGVSSSITAATTPYVKKRDRKSRVRPKAFVARWKRQPMPHLGHIELDGKQVESVTLTCAAAIDSILFQVCGDGVLKSTLTMKEQSSEHSRLSVAKRRALGIIGVPPPPGVPRPKPAPLPIPPREERTKRIRHAPQSKEYDNLIVPGAVEQVNNTSFQALAGLERKPPVERRKESRQDVALKKASLVIVDPSYAREVEVPVEKPKKEKKREREREEVVNKNAISYDELLRQKTQCMERLPGRVLGDRSDFFYREIFTDNLGEDVVDENSPDIDVIGFGEPPKDDMKSFVAFGVQATDAATKLIEVLPRPPPYTDEDDDLEEEKEWMDEDMKKALSHHSSSRRELVEQVLRMINSQRTTDLTVQGTKGAQDVLYNSYVANAYRLRELLPVFSEFRLGESSWLHRSLIRLLPSHLLSVYIDILRFLRSIDSKLAALLSKSLTERGVDKEWDELFEKDATTEDDRTEAILTTDNEKTEPMLNGSVPATAATSSQTVAAADAASDDVTAALEAILKALEKAELDAAAAAESAPSPGSNEGGLVIDEGPQEEEETASPGVDGVAADAAAVVGDVTLVEDVIVEESVEKKKPNVQSVCSILAEVADKKVREGNADKIHNSINPHLLGDVIPILIAPVFDIEETPEDFVMKNKPYEYIYRLIRYATPSPSDHKTIRPRIPAGEMSVAEAMDAAVDFVVAAVKAAVKNKGNKRVVLFGWGLSCYINLRVAQLLHGISAIINFAFPLSTIDGWRGTPDDDINLTYCPTLFVMGSEAEDFDPYELLLLRQNMIQSPGVLILGSADSQLNISSLRLNREGITQKIVARMILEQVINFINMPANQLERAKLVPLQLNNVYFVEPLAVKACTGPEAQQALVAGGGRRTMPHTPIDGGGMTAAQSLARRQQQQMENNKRKRSRMMVDEQTTAMGRLTSSIASSAAPITKRSRTDDLPTSSYGGRIGPDYRFSMPIPSPLASPALNSPGFRNRPAILSHNHHYNYHNPALPSPIASGSSAAAAASSSGLLLQTATTRPATAAAAAPSPRGPLDPASISLS
ncbi:hypothetical protein PENTCL1PPCAC_1846 [Pristionchus entomophagus]|uniref:KANSL3 helical domain-containing protein n=1 Tax=Pristionchus entomophagus TaxID=358040 RepID=A0AAV5SJ43_9BILA|nr:hypothetical protein PENTCL1PPCAC_1846 [Pristionchus entomophagus]